MTQEKKKKKGPGGRGGGRLRGQRKVPTGPPLKIRQKERCQCRDPQFRFYWRISAAKLSNK